LPTQPPLLPSKHMQRLVFCLIFFSILFLNTGHDTNPGKPYFCDANTCDQCFQSQRWLTQHMQDCQIFCHKMSDVAKITVISLHPQQAGTNPSLDEDIDMLPPVSLDCALYTSPDSTLTSGEVKNATECYTALCGHVVLNGIPPTYVAHLGFDIALCRCPVVAIALLQIHSSDFDPASNLYQRCHVSPLQSMYG
jgi:hypothetical protein